MKKVLSLIVVFVMGSLILNACNFPVASTPTQSLDLVKTLAMKTVNALNTEIAAGKSATPALPATWTPGPPQPTITLALSSTPILPTITPTPAEPCDKATFVRDVTIPDGDTLPPATPFTKTWELRNDGSCIWNSLYSLVFGNDGNAMNGPASKPLIPSGTVVPGQSVQVSVDLIAPATAGKYKAIWKIRNPQNNLFAQFWVDITVGNEYSFVQNLCSAEWKSGAGNLPCPGKEAENKGFAIRLENPKIETGAVENEDAILTVPQPVDNGEISGKFTPVVIPNNSLFKTVVGCMDLAKDCNVQFTIKYQVAGSSEQVLASGEEKFEGDLTRIEKDLNSLGLSGKAVTFTFSVKANGSSKDDRIFWLLPRIVPKP